MSCLLGCYKYIGFHHEPRLRQQSLYAIVPVRLYLRKSNCRAHTHTWQLSCDKPRVNLTMLASRCRGSRYPTSVSWTGHLQTPCKPRLAVCSSPQPLSSLRCQAKQGQARRGFSRAVPSFKVVRPSNRVESRSTLFSLVAAGCPTRYALIGCLLLDFSY